MVTKQVVMVGGKGYEVAVDQRDTDVIHMQTERRIPFATLDEREFCRRREESGKVVLDPAVLFASMDEDTDASPMAKGFCRLHITWPEDSEVVAVVECSACFRITDDGYQFLDRLFDNLEALFRCFDECADKDVAKIKTRFGRGVEECRAKEGRQRRFQTELRLMTVANG